MSNQRGQKTFAFYGRTRPPMATRRAEATRERDRQLSVATELADTVSGKIILTLFDTHTHPLSALRHRERGRRLLEVLVDPARPFDAVVLGDTRLSTSAGQFDDLALLCSAHDVELWCPEIGGAYEWGNASHEGIMWRLFWGPHDFARPRR
jgi:site-specific DNA recombinase